MQFETFRGRSVEEAVAAVKAAYGADAMIGSTRRVTNGRSGVLGSTFVEVTAAPALPASARTAPFAKSLQQAKAQPAPAPTSLPRARQLPARTTQQTAARSQAAEDAEFAELQRKLQDESGINVQLSVIRSMLEEITAVHRPKDRAVAMLNSARIEGKLATKLAAGAGRQSHAGAAGLRAWLRQRLAEKIRVTPSPIDQPGPRVIVCVGPTGVGKTTTLAKLAASAHIDAGRSVSVVTLDTFRVGSVEQMRRFAQLIGVSFDVAQDKTAFAHAVQTRRAELTFVDTASLPATDTAAMRRLTECLETVSGRPVDILLVLPASIHPNDAERLVASYKSLGLTGLVITKLDEAEQVGGVMHAALPGPVPIAYLCGGPRVPEDIREATVESVLNHVLPVEP